MILRAVGVWFVLFGVAFALGVARVGLLEPRLGDRPAHVLGTLAVVAAFALIIWSIVEWVVPALDRTSLVLLGTGWTVATAAFEFGFGRYVMGHPWSRLLRDYDLTAGRLWLLVLLTLLLAPFLAGEVRRP